MARCLKTVLPLLLKFPFIPFKEDSIQRIKSRNVAEDDLFRRLK